MFLSLLVCACGDKALDTAEPAPVEEVQGLSFEADIRPLFIESSCDNCHQGLMTTYETLVSSMAGDFDASVNECILMPWVTPFKPEQSFLQHKIDGTFEGMDNGEGLIMDMNDGDQDIVRQWILDGALP